MLTLGELVNVVNQIPKITLRILGNSFVDCICAQSQSQVGGLPELLDVIELLLVQGVDVRRSGPGGGGGGSRRGGGDLAQEPVGLKEEAIKSAEMCILHFLITRLVGAMDVPRHTAPFNMN